MRDVHGRQRRREAVDERHVVEARDRNVVRTAQAMLLQGVEAAEREQVVGRDDRSEAHTFGLNDRRQ